MLSHRWLRGVAAALIACAAAGCAGPGPVEIRVMDGDQALPSAVVALTGRIPVVGETFPVRATEPADGRADATGVVSFANVEPGGYELYVRHPDFVTHREPDFRAAGGARAVHTVQLRRGARVRGRLLDASGAPLKAIHVEAVSGGELSDSARTGDDGRFLTSAAEPQAPIELSARWGGTGYMTVAAARVESPAVGVNEAGDVRALDTKTTLRFDGEMPHHPDPEAVRNGWPLSYELKLRGSFAAARPGGAFEKFEFEGAWLAEDRTYRIHGLPEGTLRWTLEEVRVGNLPTNVTVAEGETTLAGPRRDVVMKPTPSGK
jgi:hypothetical protein